MDELLAQFLIEAPELVQQASDALLALERDPSDAAQLDQAFRAFHTLKGSVALFGQAPLVEALSAGEDILSAVRAKRQPLVVAAVDGLMGLLAKADEWLPGIATSPTLSEAAAAECRAMAASLAACLGEGPAEAPAPVADTGWTKDLVARATVVGAGEALVALRYRPDAECFFRGDDPLGLVRQIPDLRGLALHPAKDWGDLGVYDPFRCNLVIDALTAAPLDAMRQLFRLVKDQVTLVEIAPIRPAAPAETSSAGARFLRVDSAKVDGLLDIVGELVVAKNGLAHVAAQAERATDIGEVQRSILASKQVFDRLIGTLHQAVMGVRLVPLRRRFEGLPRLVREIAQPLGRNVDFVMQGETTEVDKSIVDGLFEPVLHLLRNAVDHGLENADARLAAGKPAQGRIGLRAVRDGDFLVVEVSDDGKGIDVEAVRRAARRRDALDGAAIEALSDEEAIDLVFLPGVSTRQDVSDLSGRGVGMDAVRTAIEKLGGRVGLTSRRGSGVTARMTLPLSAVLTKVLTVKLGQDLYGVATDAVLETVRLTARDILAVGSGAAFVLRDRTLPLLHLQRLLGGEAVTAEAEVKVMIVRCGGERVGIAVDAFAEPLEVMVRPLVGLLSGLPGLRGTTVLGDGRVLMILDLAELIE